MQRARSAPAPRGAAARALQPARSSRACRRRSARRTFTLGSRRFGIGPRERERRALRPGELSPAHARGLPDAAHDARRRAPRDDGNGRSILVTGPVAVGGQDHHRDQPRFLVRAGRQARDPDRGRLPPADGGRGAGRARPRGHRQGAARQRRARGGARAGASPSATTCACCWSTAPTTGWPRCSRCRPPRRCSRTAKRLADYVVLDSPPLTEVIDALPLARQVDDVLLVMPSRLEQPRRSWRGSATCSSRTRSARPASWSSAARSSEESSYYREARAGARPSRDGS